MLCVNFAFNPKDDDLRVAAFSGAPAVWSGKEAGACNPD
jgi:hypothetical protein